MYKTKEELTQANDSLGYGFYRAADETKRWYHRSGGGSLAANWQYVPVKNVPVAVRNSFERETRVLPRMRDRKGHFMLYNLMENGYMFWQTRDREYVGFMMPRKESKTNKTRSRAGKKNKKEKPSVTPRFFYKWPGEQHYVRVARQDLPANLREPARVAMETTLEYDTI